MMHVRSLVGCFQPNPSLLYTGNICIMHHGLTIIPCHSTPQSGEQQYQAKVSDDVMQLLQERMTHLYVSADHDLNIEWLSLGD